VVVALAATAALAAPEIGLGRVAVQPFQPFTLATLRPLPGYAQDLAVPWWAGVTLAPAAAAYLVGLAVYLASVGRSAIRLRAYPPEHRERARAMLTYAAAPLAWLLPAAACHAAALPFFKLEEARSGDVGPRAVWLTLEILAALVAAVAVCGGFHRSSQWFARAHHGGAGRYAAGLAELLGRSLLGLVVFLGIVPWCVGFSWIVWDSFR
jgi:hypothetical protein